MIVILPGPLLFKGTSKRNTAAAICLRARYALVVKEDSNTFRMTVGERLKTRKAVICRRRKTQQQHSTKAGTNGFPAHTIVYDFITGPQFGKSDTYED
jgi:hypothetical protein